jgi:uncharacterized OB-fold protein
VNAPSPRPDPASADDAQFWAFLDAGVLRIQQCTDCSTFRHPPRPLCAACGSTATAWAESSGRGEVWARTIIHPPTLPAFATRTPYGAVVVRLDEGVFMVSNVVDRDPDDVVVGMRVELAITEVEPGLRLPLFRSCDGERSSVQT